MTTTPQTETQMPHQAIMLAVTLSHYFRTLTPPWVRRVLDQLHRIPDLEAELRRLDAENQQLKELADGQRMLMAGMRSELDQLRAQVERLQGGEPVAWLDLSKMSPSGMVYATGFKVSSKQSPVYAAQPAAPVMVALTPQAVRAEFTRLQNDESQSFISDLHDFTQGVRFAERAHGIGQPAGGEGDHG